MKFNMTPQYSQSVGGSISGSSVPFSADKPPLPLSWYRPDDGLLKMTAHAGQRFHLVSHWISSLNAERLHSILSSLVIDSVYPFSLSIENFEPVYVFPLNISIFFPGAFTASQAARMELLSGRYLRTIISCDCFDCAAGALDELLRRIIRTIRLLAGTSSALAVVIKSVFDSVTNISKVCSEGIKITPEIIGEGLELSAISPLDLPVLSCGIRLNIKPEAGALFDLAIQSSENSVRFLLYWIAIEAQVGSSGRARERFFKEQLNSTLINSEVKRLHDDVRTRVAHLGNMRIESWDLISVLWVFRLTVVVDNDVRSVLKKSFEAVLLEHAGQRH